MLSWPAGWDGSTRETGWSSSCRSVVPHHRAHKWSCSPAAASGRAPAAAAAAPPAGWLTSQTGSAAPSSRHSCHGPLPSPRRPASRKEAVLIGGLRLLEPKRASSATPCTTSHSALSSASHPPAGVHPSPQPSPCPPGCGGRCWPRKPAACAAPPRCSQAGQPPPSGRCFRQSCRHASAGPAPRQPLTAGGRPQRAQRERPAAGLWRPRNPGHRYYVKRRKGSAGGWPGPLCCAVKVESHHHD